MFIKGERYEFTVQASISHSILHFSHPRRGGGLVDAAITTRTQEPVVLTAAQFPAFFETPVDQIFLYKVVNGQWVEVPAQIDEVELDDSLLDNMSDNCHYDHDPCEWAYVLSGTEGNKFDSDSGMDELVFMARDVGSEIITNSHWVGTPGVTTLNTRYRITVVDNEAQESGHLYAYAWIGLHDHDESLADYVAAAPASEGEPCEPVDDPGCGWLRATNEGSIGSLPRFNMYFAGNWSMEAMCIKPYATDATCTIADSSKNLLDLTKVRTTIPLRTEHMFDENCRNVWPVKDGRVRLIRRTQGASSGRYTTKVEKFYGTWFEQTVNLRVHPIGSIDFSIDHRVVDPQNPSNETPSLVFTKNSWGLNTAAMDLMDLEPQENHHTNYQDWIQVDTSRGTYVRFDEAPRPLRDVSQSFVYEDNTIGTVSDNQPGMKYGQSGNHDQGTGPGGCFENTDGDACDSESPEDPGLNFARFVKTLIPLAIDTPSGSPLIYRPEEAILYEEYRTGEPFTVGVQEQVYGEPEHPKPGPCVPVLAAVGSPDAFGIESTVSGCPEYAGFMLYRGLAPGSYDFLADLKAQTVYNDMKIQQGVTYRYAARAYDADGDLSNWSNEVVISVTDTVPPPAATGVTATAGPGRIILDWTDPGSKDVHQTEVRSSMDSGGPYTLAAPPAFCGSATAAVTGLNPGTTYYFVVVTSDSAGNETESIEISATPY